MTSIRAGNEQPEHVRHYPLDMDLPFDRYEHRRLAARDILVHRIMTRFLFPDSKGLAQVFDTHRSKATSLHNFGTVKRYDKILARDLQLLRKMLATTGITDDLYDPSVKPVRVARLHLGGLGGLQPPYTILDFPMNGDDHLPVTVGEEIMDLVRRHYFEIDDPATRLWLHATRPLVPSSYNTLSSIPKAKDTRAASVQKRTKLDRTNCGREEKRWYSDDTEHLKSLQEDTRTSHSLGLYDGGALLPPLRQSLLQSHASRKKHLEMKAEQGDGILQSLEEHWAVIKDAIYPFPGADTPRTVLHVPSWRSWRHKHHWFRDMQSSPPVDFADGRTGRGMDRDGMWSTGRWVEEEGERGRAGRRGRRRASSEPPPDMFTSARLPWGFYNPRELMIFSKMNLKTVDRRSRRRSLSRTRIAEMFDWNTVFATQPVKENLPVNIQNPGGRQPARTSPPMNEKPTCVHEIEQRLENLRRRRAEEFEWVDINGLYDDILVTLQAKGFPSKPCCHGTGPGSCSNCTSTGHATSKCRKPCGFCGAPSPKTIYPAISSRRVLSAFGDEAGQHGNLHMASDCPVARHNRCKCGPFPQYHVSAKCAVLCSRNCGNGHPPGHFKHRNAMTCRARCCMCGTKGHSGQQCKLKRCRCGGTHLGQDCRWKVECRVKGCDKYLCGVHCSGCGIPRGEMEEGLGFYEGMCPLCFSETGGATAGDVAVDDGGNEDEERERSHGVVGAQIQRTAPQKGRRRNIRKTRDPEGKKKEKQELPWYAPLQPRTRPIVTSKSGKKTTWKN